MNRSSNFYPKRADWGLSRYDKGMTTLLIVQESSQGWRAHNEVTLMV